MRVAVSGRADLPRRVDLAKRVIDSWVRISGEEPLVTEGFARALGMKGQKLNELDADTVITVGGDGTILWTLLHNDAPVLGVNDGQLGFLTEVHPDAIDAALRRLYAADYFIESRSKLEVRLNDERLGACTNEVVVKTPRPSKILNFKVMAGEHVIDNVRADGLIVATPTGSTSYAFSAGGPLVSPELDAILVVPIAPFRVALRPLVLPANVELRLVLGEREKEAVCALDGQLERHIGPDDQLVIRRTDEKARFIRFTPHFFVRMRQLFG